MNLLARPLNPWKDLILHLGAWAVLLALPSLFYSFAPNSDFDLALKRAYPNETAIVLGGHSQFSGSGTLKRRSYVLFPSVLIDPKFVQVEQRNSSTPAVLEERGLFLATLVIFFGFCSYYFWRRWRTRPDDA